MAFKLLFLFVILYVTAIHSKPVEDEHKNDGTVSGIQKVPLPLAIAPHVSETPKPTDVKRPVRDISAQSTIAPPAVLATGVKPTDVPVSTLKTSVPVSRTSRSVQNLDEKTPSSDDKKRPVRDTEKHSDQPLPSPLGKNAQTPPNHDDSQHRNVRDTPPDASKVPDTQGSPKVTRDTKEKITPPNVNGAKVGTGNGPVSSKPGERHTRDIDNNSTPKVPLVKIPDVSGSTPKPTSDSSSTEKPFLL